MSRIGKRAIAVPSGVTANVEGQTVKVKGPKGALQAALHDDVTVKLDGGQIKIEPRAETKRARAQWGTSRTLVANLISGVTKGFEQRLEISGVGYRAAVQGKNLQLALGYSHDIVYPIPEGISIATPRPVEIIVTGSDRPRVGQVAAEIREYQPPEPYKILSDRPEELTCPCKEQRETEPGHFAQACQSACSSEEEANEQAAQPAFAPGAAR